MVHTLQKKFIRSSMLAVAILLVILVGAINLLHYAFISGKQYRLLKMILSTDAQPWRVPPVPGEVPESGNTLDREKPFAEGEEKGAFPGGQRISMDEVMSLRFFAVWLDEDGKAVRADVSRIYAVDREEAVQLAEGAVSKGRMHGRWQGFRFLAGERNILQQYIRPAEGNRESGTGQPAVPFIEGMPEAAEAGRERDYLQDSLQKEALSEKEDLSEKENLSEKEDLSEKENLSEKEDLSEKENLSEKEDLTEEENLSDASTLFAAMDVSGDSRELWSVLGISLLIACISWLLMLVPVRALSSRAIAPTVQGMERQKQFITNAGHELKTPLAIIQANAEALELFSGESKWTRNILAQTDRLGILMQDLLTLARMDEEGMQVRMEDFDFTALVREAWEPFAVTAAANGVEVEFEAGAAPDGKAGICVRANRENTARILSILFDNAVKYTPKGGSIRIAASAVPGGVQFSQSNTADAAGIPEDADRLFERFFRADEDRSRRKGGYGIGLSAAKALAEANRGRIFARSEGNRICFYLILLPGKPAS